MKQKRKSVVSIILATLLTVSASTPISPAAAAMPAETAVVADNNTIGTKDSAYEETSPIDSLQKISYEELIRTSDDILKMGTATLPVDQNNISIDDNSGENPSVQSQQNTNNDTHTDRLDGDLSLLTNDNNEDESMWNDSGDLTDEEGIPDDAYVIRSQGDYYNLLDDGSDEPMDRDEQLPLSVDNSTSEFFPEIDSQGGMGSCTCWAQVYYQFTYSFNKHHNIKTTKDNTFSPNFNYKFANRGVNKGSGEANVYITMKNIGCLTVADAPIDNDFKQWPTDGNVWRKAAYTRIKDYQFFTELGVSGKTDITSPDDPDLIPVKTALNHGEILAFTSHSPANSWQYLTLTAASDAEINKGCIGQYTMKSADYNKGGHRMTIVGYNDNIWTDINGNHQIDAGEMGAFKIANSWGKSYRNGGFSWVAYDALNAKSSVAGVTNASERQRAIRYIGRLEVADYDNSPQFLLKATVNTSNRYRTKLTVIQKKDGKENKMVIYPIATLYSGTSYDPLTFDGLTIDAGQTAKDATVVVDLKALDPELTRANLSSYEWYLECDDNLADGRPFTVKNVEIDDEATGYAYQAKTTPLTLENKKETVAIECQSEGAMVYYRGYNNPVIRYQVEGSSDWVNVSGEKMVYDLTQYGYDHFYLINLGMAESALVDFGDGKGAWDTNNGSHYVVKKGNNFFVTPDVGEPLVLNIKNSFGTLCDIGCTDSIYPETTGGYAPYTIKMVMKNLSTGKMVKEETFTVSDHKAEGFLYQYTEQGTYQAEITVTDAAKSAVKKSVNVKVEDMPFKITGFGITDVQLDYAPGDTIELTAKTANDSIDKNSIITFSAVKDNLVYSKQELSVADEANIRQKSSLTKWSWTPSEPGKYILTVHRADADGNYASRSMTLTVSSYHPVTFRSLTVNPSANIAMGENVKVTANASSDSSTLEYRYSYVRYGRETIVSDYSASASCTYCFNDGIGAYKIVVTAKNKSGESECMTRDIWVEPTYIETLSADKTSAKAGDTVIFSAKLLNEASSLTSANYVYTVSKSGKTAVLTTNSNKTASWKPEEKGTYTVTLSVTIGGNVLDTLSVEYSVAENPEYTDNNRILVGVISYVVNEGNSGSYAVHYWGGSAIGDASCKALGTTQSKSVGSAYWSGSKQTFYLYEAYIPKDATGYKFHIGDRWFGTDGSTSSTNTVYVFNYSGDKCLYEKTSLEIE